MQALRGRTGATWGVSAKQNDLQKLIQLVLTLNYEQVGECLWCAHIVHRGKKLP